MGTKRRVAIATVILVLGGGGLAWLSARQAQTAIAPAPQSGRPATSSAPARPTRAQVPRLARAQIDEIAVFGPRGDARVARQPDGKWRVTVPFDAPADERAVRAALDVLSTLESRGVISEDASMHRELGVDPGIRVLAKAKGEPLLEAHIGVYDAGTTALRVGGFDTVFRVDGALRYAFDKRPAAFRDRRLTHFDGKQVEALEFTSGNGHFHFVRQPGTPDGWSQVLAAGETAVEPLNTRELSSIANIAGSLEASEFVEPGLSDEATGLGGKAATMKVRLAGAEARTIVYEIGALVVGGDTYYVRIGGSDAIYTVGAHIGSRFTPSAVPGVLKRALAPAAAPPAG